MIAHAIQELYLRACFKKKFITAHFPEKFLDDLFLGFYPKNLYIFSLKNSDDLFFFFFFFFSSPLPPFYAYPHALLHVSMPSLCSRNNKYSVNYLFLLNSSLHKQPFITAHFRSSLHILCITAHKNKPCAP